MRTVNLQEIAEAIGGVIRQGDPAVSFNKVATDSRMMEPGSLFIPLRGERYDAHRFLEQAVAAGAGGLVVDREIDLPAGDIPMIKVADTLTSLQCLAAWNRERCRIPLVGITGSTGKTTTKDLLAAILSVRMRTVKTIGNFNNEIGLPLTLLHLEERSEIAVIEMGMRGLGQIDALCRIAKPTGAVITNIGDAHLELLGSVENIAAAKGEILDNLPDSGFAVLHAGSKFIKREARRCKSKIIYFGIEQNCDVLAKNIRPENGGNYFTVEMSGFKEVFFLPIPGEHNVLNALAAIAVSRELGFSADDIAVGLQNAVISDMRLEIVETRALKIVNDTYNANPVSTRAALQVLCEVSSGRRTVAVLGDMLELGVRTVEGHLEIGKSATEIGINKLITVGKLAAIIAEGARSHGMDSSQICCCDNKEEAKMILRNLLLAGDVVLVKGSRGMRMEQIVDVLRVYC